MFFIESCLYSNVYDAYLFLVTRMTKPRNTWYLLYKQWLCKYKAYEGYIEFDAMQKAQKDKKLVSQKSRKKMQTCISLVLAPFGDFILQTI